MSSQIREQRSSYARPSPQDSIMRRLDTAPKQFMKRAVPAFKDLP